MELLDFVLLGKNGIILAILWGLLWGSFFNVCIYRIPLGQSVIRPASHCPICHIPIRFFDNIPLLSWLLLGGRCRNCRAFISYQYPIIELITMLLSLGLYIKFIIFGRETLPLRLSQFLVYFFFTGSLLVLSVIDLRHYKLPNRITYIGIPVFFGLGRLLNDIPWQEAIIGLAVGYGGLRFIADAYKYFTKRQGLGYGDAKLLMMCGGLLGYKALPFILLLGSVSGLIVIIPVAIYYRVYQKMSMKQIRLLPIPLGPFLSIAAVGLVFIVVGKSYEFLLNSILL